MIVTRKYPDAGARPTLRWIGKMHLRIDARYQRDVSTKRGQALVRKIAAEWRWAHCLPLVVTDNFDGTFNVIDGQHRLSAADARPDIAELPCYVIPTETLQDEAQAFVAYNRDRVQLTPLAVYHALVAARDAGAQVIADACKAARVVVLKQPKMLDECAFNEAQCIGALRAVVRAWGGGSSRPNAQDPDGRVAGRGGRLARPAGACGRGSVGGCAGRCGRADRRGPRRTRPGRLARSGRRRAARLQRPQPARVGGCVAKAPAKEGRLA